MEHLRNCPTLLASLLRGVPKPTGGRACFMVYLSKALSQDNMLDTYDIYVGRNMDLQNTSKYRCFDVLFISSTSI